MGSEGKAGFQELERGEGRQGRRGGRERERESSPEREREESVERLRLREEVEVGKEALRVDEDERKRQEEVIPDEEVDVEGDGELGDAEDNSDVEEVEVAGKHNGEALYRGRSEVKKGNMSTKSAPPELSLSLSPKREV